MVKKFQTPTVSVTIDDDELIKGLKAMGDNVEAVLERAGKAGAEVIHNAAESKVGGNIGVEVKEKDRQHILMIIGPDKEHWYYQFFETGATAHEIRASKAKALIFEGTKGIVITKRVAHTGMIAKPFLRPAFDTQQEEAKEAAGGELKRAVEAACQR